jgi:predicted nucleotidyltransferase
LIGSYARKDYSEYSDIDILLITSKDIKRSEILRYIDSSVLKNKLSLLPYSKMRFTEMYKNGNLFVRHVMAEGELLFDDGFVKELNKEPFPSTRNDSLKELSSIKERLKFYNDPSIFNNLFSDCFYRIYRLFSRVMIIGVALRNEYEFNRHKAIKRLIELYPFLKDDVLSLEKLEKYSFKANMIKDKDSTTMSESDVQENVAKLKKVIEFIESKYTD